MPAYRNVDGDLLDATEQYIVHQANCITQRAAGLAAAIFKRFPHADFYTGRIDPDLPGTIRIDGAPGTDLRAVIALFGQLHPGRPWPADPHAAREGFFKSGLEKIAVIPDIESVALPHGIGCGLAGGYWPGYEAMIDAFARQHPHIDVALYRKHD